MEGSLIVFGRSISPKYGFFILNRRGVENIFELVDVQLQFKYEKPYLLYKTKQSTIVGIWFYVEKEQHRITSLLTKLSVDTRYNQGKEEELSGTWVAVRVGLGLGLGLGLLVG